MVMVMKTLTSDQLNANRNQSSNQYITSTSTSLNDEINILSRLVYLNKNQHRALIWYKKSVEVYRWSKKVLKVLSNPIDVTQTNHIVLILNFLIEAQARLLRSYGSIMQSVARTAFMSAGLVIIASISRIRALYECLETHLQHLVPTSIESIKRDAVKDDVASESGDLCSTKSSNQTTPRQSSIPEPNPGAQLLENNQNSSLEPVAPTKSIKVESPPYIQAKMSTSPTKPLDPAINILPQAFCSTASLPQSKDKSLNLKTKRTDHLSRPSKKKKVKKDALDEIFGDL
ncbi:uncharacterized protein MELLADRAFT_118163 [Melampsora larici-populina 98AG31]|uniref:RNase MRP protein 1 RNA binding domain-containing protein n=1 Tax=Melampsora larici-populina (strain 98AG31 / pathotype 3-4-7) TaxID=747676 RepID=F4S5R3_MELLP|nr:uncharacterized protein MELLADRAFT_118163 [Melampsora larici-populina 98AG31]EGG00020.1 hypothetical protein MELLADRAFT_118163 [Melampsora larici-populina 98AG31]